MQDVNNKGNLVGEEGVCGNSLYFPINFSVNLKLLLRDFPGGPVGKTLHSQCRGPEFDPWLGN